MAIRGDSKSMNLSKPKVLSDERRKRACPHPFCFEQIFGLHSDLLDHYQKSHGCGRCNQGKHHKCRKDLCGCPCRWGNRNENRSLALKKIFEAAFRRPKIDGEKLNEDIKRRKT